MTSRSGFTLVELSIVLIIIGLLAGGVLVGKELIHAAEIRAQISQIERYQVAVRTFQTKYNCLPGDCARGADFGFPTRGAFAGQGDGNGVIEGNFGFADSDHTGVTASIGETALFWEDLSKAELIEGAFKGTPEGGAGGGASTCANPKAYAGIVVPGVSCDHPFNVYIPAAKIGGGNYLHVWSGGWGADYRDGTGSGSGGSNLFGFEVPGNGVNYFALVEPDMLLSGAIFGEPGLAVSDAFSIDSKVDDGNPQQGKVTAMYVNENFIRSGRTGVVGFADGNRLGDPYANGATAGTPDTTATAADAFTCFDNAGVAGIQHYSMSTNGGRGVNCALSFEFQ